MRVFSVWNKRARVFTYFSCQILSRLVGTQKLAVIQCTKSMHNVVLNSSFHSASDQTKITFVYGWYISSSFSFFFAASNLCSSHKSRARYFCKKKSLQFFFRLNHLSSVVARFLPETCSFPIYQTCVGTIFWWGWRRLVGWRNCNIIMFKIK